MAQAGFRKAIMPARYVQGAGVIGQLGTYARQFGTRPFVVSGRTAFSKVKARLQASLLAAGTPMIGHDDTVTECTYDKIAEVTRKAESLGADVIIGCGGGKAADTAKAVGDKLGLTVITVPTQCATNADQMADAVIFTEDHRFVEDYYLSRAPALVLVDAEIAGLAPVKFLVQGMGDALASGYEKPAFAAAMRARKSEEQASSAALEINLKCFEVLMANGVQAKKDAERGIVSESLEAVIEAIKLMSGFGFGGGGCAAAHAIHNGLTALDGIERKHGEIVAYGTIVQMVLEKRPLGEIERVMRWCIELGLPVRLADLGKLDVAQLPVAAEKACDPKDTMPNMPFPVTPSDVLAAMREVERLADDLA
ncbi:TPA: glycerol dehydrogenase [Thermoplasmata archaeon]|nr:glycerol dehydrogenase [Thermoplasmata archaeon]